MPSAKNPAARPAATIINATAKTRSVIEDLQARLALEVRSHLPPPTVAVLDLVQPSQSLDDLERELQAYFDQASPKPSNGSASTNPSRSQILDELRNRVIDGVVDRILAEWTKSPSDTPNSLGLGREVMDRLIERVLEEFRKTASKDLSGA